MGKLDGMEEKKSFPLLADVVFPCFAGTRGNLIFLLWSYFISLYHATFIKIVNYGNSH